MHSSRKHQLALRAVLILLLPTGLVRGQSSVAPIISGLVQTAGARAVEGADVFVLGTLDGALTGADGRFAIVTSDTGTVILVVRRVGFAPARRTVHRAERGDVLIELLPAARPLAPVMVQAGRYSADNERGATLTSLEVVTIPGAAADVNRAIQTLPGVQQVDEGTGLFVRGGDYTETKVFLDDAAILNPQDIQSPNGTFTGTVDPFLLDGIVFSSGGFGARFGNALSGVVSLHTQARPAQSGITASTGLAALSASIAQPVGRSAGVRAAANVFNLIPLLRVNGSWQHYTPPPKGHDLSGSATWKSAHAGEISVFVIEQASRLGVGVEDPSYAGTYGFDGVTDFAVANWHAAFGRFVPSLSVSTAHSSQREEFGALDLARGSRMQQGFAQLEWAASDRATLRAGVEAERLRTSLAGSVPLSQSDQAPGARINVLASKATGIRSALFGESDLRVGSHTRVVVGVRTDSSSLTHQRTLDPRISAAYRTDFGATLTAAWGVYHEVPDPLLFDPTVGDTTLRSMRATHSIVGLQIGQGATKARIELYDKRYSDLAQQNRDYITVAGGRGFARGIDVFLKGNGPLGTIGRLTFSHLISRRTDPNSGVIADAPFDIPNTLTLIIERTLPHGWQLGGAYRYASGKPFTPISGATLDTTLDPAQRRWLPIYGAPNSEHLPRFSRLDLSVSNYRPISQNWKIVLYADINNVLGRNNVYMYSYTPDYRERIPVRSIFNRSLYFGATIIH